MVFSDTDTKAGILQECENEVFSGDYGAITDNTNRLSRFTALSNRALERITVLIREAQGRWQWEDGNNTDFPIATAALVADQQDYALDGTSHFRIERVEVQDSAGNWTKLTPFDQVDIYDQALTDFLADTGLPQYYDKLGNSLFLYPTPDYSQAASLKLYFERGPSYFLSSDTIKTPGFNPLFHRLIPMWASYDYDHTRDGAKELREEIAVMESDLTEFYARRDRDEHTRLTALRINAR